MAYTSKILDERSFRNRRFVLEYSVTDHTHIIKAVYKIPGEEKAREIFEKLTTQRRPTDIMPEAPAPEKESTKNE